MNSAYSHGVRLRAFLFAVLLMPLLLQCKAGPEEGTVQGTRKATPSATPCQMATGPCRVPYADGVVGLDIGPRPLMSMRELEFKVTLINLAGTKARALDLSMPGMYMGPNMVTLKPTALEPWVYIGKGVFARCPSGGSRWRARVIMVAPDKSEGEAVFEFEVGR